MAITGLAGAARYRGLAEVAVGASRQSGDTQKATFIQNVQESPKKGETLRMSNFHVSKFLKMCHYHSVFNPNTFCASRKCSVASRLLRFVNLSVFMLCCRVLVAAESLLLGFDVETCYFHSSWHQ